MSWHRDVRPGEVLALDGRVESVRRRERGAVGRGHGRRRDRARVRGRDVRADRRRPTSPTWTTPSGCRRCSTRDARRDERVSPSPASARSRRSATTPVDLGGAQGRPQRRPARSTLRRRARSRCRSPGSASDFDARPAARPATPRATCTAASASAWRRRAEAMRDAGIEPGHLRAGRDRRGRWAARVDRPELQEFSTRSRCEPRATGTPCTASRRSDARGQPEHRRRRRSRALAGAEGPMIGVSTACTASAHCDRRGLPADPGGRGAS